MFFVRYTQEEWHTLLYDYMAQHMLPEEKLDLSSFEMECSNYCSMFTTIYLLVFHPEIMSNHTITSLCETVKLLINFDGLIRLDDRKKKNFFECFTIDVDEDDKKHINVFVDEILILRMFKCAESMLHHPWTTFHNNDVNPNTEISMDEDTYSDDLEPYVPEDDEEDEEYYE